MRRCSSSCGTGINLSSELHEKEAKEYQDLGRQRTSAWTSFKDEKDYIWAWLGKNFGWRGRQTLPRLTSRVSQIAPTSPLKFLTFDFLSTHTHTNTKAHPSTMDEPNPNALGNQLPIGRGRGSQQRQYPGQQMAYSQGPNMCKQPCQVLT